MLKRIKKIGRLRNTFSFRDTKLLKKYGKKQLKETKKNDFEDLVQYFPGKTAETLETHFLKSVKRKSNTNNQKLNNIDNL